MFIRILILLTQLHLISNRKWQHWIDASPESCCFRTKSAAEQNLMRGWTTKQIQAGICQVRCSLSQRRYIYHNRKTSLTGNKRHDYITCKSKTWQEMKSAHHQAKAETPHWLDHRVTGTIFPHHTRYLRRKVTFLQSSQWVGEAPRIPNSSAHRMHCVEPFPKAFFFMFSTRSTNLLQKVPIFFTFRFACFSAV